MTNTIESLVKINHLKILWILLKQKSELAYISQEKKNRLVLKYFVLIILTTVSGLWTCYNLVGNKPGQIFMMMNFHTFSSSKFFQYTILSDILGTKLTSLKCEIKKLNKNMAIVDGKMLKYKLAQTRKAYELIHDMAELLNYVSAYSILSIFLFLAFTLIVLMFWAMSGFLKNVVIISYSCKSLS